MLMAAWLLSVASLEAGLVQFEDGVLDPREWFDTVVVIDNSSVGGNGPLTSTGSVLQRTTGGVPTAYRRSRHVVDPGDAIRTGGIYLADHYIPKLQGPLESVSFRINANNDPLQLSSAGATGWRPILLQDDRLYWSKEQTVFDGSGWSLQALPDLEEDDFDSSPDPVADPNGEQPDFSIDGEEIYFGYAVTNSASTSAVNAYRGVDNWEVDANSASNTLIGDFNADGSINALDYVVWRNAKNGNTGGAFEGGDANGNSIADANDYDRWAMNYGLTATIPNGGAGAVVVPEPAAGMLLTFGMLAVGLARGVRSGCNDERPSNGRFVDFLPSYAAVGRIAR
jgi:hypothetical protein